MAQIYDGMSLAMQGVGNLQGAVRFEVERTVGVPVAEVNVFVQGVHEDNGTG